MSVMLALLVKTRRSAFFGSRPQISACRFKQTDKTIIDDARRIAFVENRKPRTVKPRQPVNGRQPQIAVAGLNYPVNRILRQPVDQWSIRYCAVAVVTYKQRQKHNNNFSDKFVTNFTAPKKN